MNISHVRKHGLSILAATGILAGCNGLQSANGTMPAGTMQSIHLQTLIPSAKKEKLLYIAEPNVVDIFDLPSGKQVGTLSGFDAPQGLCSDGSHVWVTNANNSKIFEYDAGSSKRVATLHDPLGYPLGCSYDKTTGNLAVANVTNKLYGEGDVAVYTGAAGRPKAYSCSGLATYRYAGYDDEGNLYVDGDTSGSAFGFCGLRKNSHAMENISLNQSIEYPGQVQWDGKYVTVSDQNANIIYRFTIKGTSGSEEGSTPLTGAGDCVQNWIVNNRVYCPNGSLAEADIYAYPAGGQPIKVIGGFEGPTAATVATSMK